MPEFDPISARGPCRGPSLGDALRALPLQAPPRSAWPSIAANLPSPRRRMRQRWLALAATVAAVAALATWQLPPAAEGTAVLATADVPAAVQDADLDAVLRESAQLEAWIAWHGTRTSESGATASLELDLRDRIAAIDAVLARPTLDPAAQWPLLQERLVRLRELAGVQNTQQLLAASGSDARAVPVAVF